MQGIVIGASSESLHAINQAKALGMYVIAFDGDKDAKGFSVADEVHILDIREPENIFAVIDKKQDMVVIPVPIGRYLTTIGAFNEHYNLIGPKKHTTEICTDKWLFHQTLSQYKLRNINCDLVKKGQTQYKPKGFPVIIKPRFGAGSREVKQLSSWAVNLPFDEDFIIEDVVNGTEYGVDGMVIAGNFYLILIRKKINTPLPYRQCVGYISVNDENLQRIVTKYMEKLVSVIDLTDGILHADIIYGKSPFVIEMSARPSGHRLHDVFTPLVTGVDMVHEYLRYSITGNFNIHVQNQEAVFMIRYFDIESEIKRVPDKDYILNKYPVLQYECNLKKHEIKKIIDGHSLMNRGFFILKGKSEKELCEIADNVLAEYEEG